MTGEARNTETLGPLAEYYGERTEMGRRIGLPEQWVVCPTCSQMEWMLPPHLFDPCPFIAQSYEQFGLKIDAERMAAVRSGISFEELLKAVRKTLGEGGEE